MTFSPQPNAPSQPLANVDPGSVRAPPHPLDAKWHLYQNDEVYGPYTGHEIKVFAADGIIEPSSNVMRVGREEWVKACDDQVLARIFQAVRPPPPATANVTAEKGATIVQVTNNLAPHMAAALLEDGATAQKSAGLALVLSLLICGGGQMYNGQVAKGFLMLFGCVALWFLMLGWIVNIWSWVDAYQTAKAMNARYQRRLAAAYSG